MEHKLSAILVTHLFVFIQEYAKLPVRYLSISHCAQTLKTAERSASFMLPRKLDPSLQLGSSLCGLV